MHISIPVLMSTELAVYVETFLHGALTHAQICSVAFVFSGRNSACLKTRTGDTSKGPD